MYVAFLEAALPPGLERGRRGYALRNIGGHQWHLMRFDPNGRAESLGISPGGSRHFPDMRPPLRMSILADLEQQIIRLYCNGARLMEWKDPRPMAEPGDFFSFLSPAERAVIADVRISNWDGVDPFAGPGVLESAPGFAGPRSEDEVLLINGDRLNGAVIELGPDAVSIRTAAGPLKVPSDRFRSIVFADPASPPPAVGTRLVRRDGDTFRVEIGAIADGVAVGKHAGFGDLRIPLNDLTRMVWRNLDPPPPVAEAPPDAAVPRGIERGEIRGRE